LTFYRLFEYRFYSFFIKIRLSKKGVWLYRRVGEGSGYMVKLLK